MAHSVTQTSFAKPCFHLVDSLGAPIGLDSGFKPVAVNATSHPTFIVDVNVSTPLWFYCAQVGHCPKGMVFGINPPATGNTMEAFIANAKQLADPIVEGAERLQGVGVCKSAELEAGS